MPPSILGEELTISVMANESVTLECRSHAVPPPKLSWQKDSRPLKLRPGIHLSQDKALLEVSGHPAPGLSFGTSAWAPLPGPLHLETGLGLTLTPGFLPAVCHH